MFGGLGGALGHLIGGLSGSRGAEQGAQLGSMLGGFGDSALKLFGFGGDYEVLGGRGDAADLQSSSSGARFMNQELIGFVYPTKDFAVQGYPINVGNSAMFPHLSRLANLFRKYRVHGMVVQYIPLCIDSITNDSIAGGRVYLACDHNASLPIPDSRQKLENYKFIVTGRKSVSFKFPFECALDYQDLVTRLVRGDIQAAKDSSNVDVNTYNFGTFYVATEGCPETSETSPIGQLVVSFDVELLEQAAAPDAPSVGQVCQLYGQFVSSGLQSTAPSNVQPLGLAPMKLFDNIGVVLKPPVLGVDMNTTPPVSRGFTQPLQPELYPRQIYLPAGCSGLWRVKYFCTAPSNIQDTTTVCGTLILSNATLVKAFSNMAYDETLSQRNNPLVCYDAFIRVEDSTRRVGIRLSAYNDAFLNNVPGPNGGTLLAGYPIPGTVQQFVPPNSAPNGTVWPPDDSGSPGAWPGGTVNPFPESLVVNMLIIKVNDALFSGPSIDQALNAQFNASWSNPSLVSSRHRSLSSVPIMSQPLRSRFSRKRALVFTGVIANQDSDVGHKRKL